MDAPERPAIEQLCAGLTPLVEGFFRPTNTERDRERPPESDRDRDRDRGRDRGRQRASMNAEESRPEGQAGPRLWYLSQLQFVDAMPGCASQ
eukprot:COSAG03_NODE_1858_length_3423_cov_7.658544_5_plen_92_part_00